MVYKNLFNRLFLSLLFLVLYFIALYNQYLILVLGTTIYLFVFYEILKFFKKKFKFILVYLFFSYLFFLLYFFNFYDYKLFNIFVLTIILLDSFSYFTGIIIGKYYIFKSISPKKTLEGYLGGIFFTNILILSYIFLFQKEYEITILLLFVNLIILTSILGDLIQSYFKRKNNIKDSSNFLPGHGGYFDRFDSFLFSIIFLTIFSLVYL